MPGRFAARWAARRKAAPYDNPSDRVEQIFRAAAHAALRRPEKMPASRGSAAPCGRHPARPRHPAKRDKARRYLPATRIFQRGQTRMSVTTTQKPGECPRARIGRAEVAPPLVGGILARPRHPAKRDKARRYLPATQYKAPKQGRFPVVSFVPWCPGRLIFPLP